MLLHNRTRRLTIEVDQPPAARYATVGAEGVAMLRWLTALGVDHVVVGAVARLVHGQQSARGPVAIVPAPYRRNLERLARGLNAEGAGERPRVPTGTADPLVTGRERGRRLSADDLACAQRRQFQLGEHALDIEGVPERAPSYQELLYAAVRIELTPALSVQVAAPEDVEFYDYARRTGVPPQIVISHA